MRDHQRRIDDQIRNLSNKVVHASDDEREIILRELLKLVHQLSERLKGRAAAVLLHGEQFCERRSTDVKHVVPSFKENLPDSQSRSRLET